MAVSRSFRLDDLPTVVSPTPRCCASQVPCFQSSQSEVWISPFRLVMSPLLRPLHVVSNGVHKANFWLRRHQNTKPFQGTYLMRFLLSRHEYSSADYRTLCSRDCCILHRQWFFTLDKESSAWRYINSTVTKSSRSQPGANCVQNSCRVSRSNSLTRVSRNPAPAHHDVGPTETHGGIRLAFRHRNPYTVEKEFLSCSSITL